MAKSETDWVSIVLGVAAGVITVGAIYSIATMTPAELEAFSKALGGRKSCRICGSEKFRVTRKGNIKCDRCKEKIGKVDKLLAA